MDWICLLAKSGREGVIPETFWRVPFEFGYFGMILGLTFAWKAENGEHGHLSDVRRYFAQGLGYLGLRLFPSGSSFVRVSIWT